MDIKPIEMERSDANAKLEAYRKRLSRMRHSKAQEDIRRTYEAAVKGYEYLAAGMRLIDLEDVFQRCGRDEAGRPRLSIARADRKAVEFRYRNDWEGSRFIFDTRLTLTNDPKPISVNVNDEAKYLKNGYSPVPLVPADIRPETGQLKDWFILWEVEKWADTRRGLFPDKDPYLLKFIEGSLYAVIAEWDLTPLEISIMKGAIAR